MKRIAGFLLLFGMAACPNLRAQTASAHPAPTAHKPAASANLPLIDLDGYKQILAKYRGKPLLVTFWATWCEPCRDEFPLIVQLAKQYAPQGLAVVGVDLDSDADMHLVRHFVEKTQPGFPSYRQKPGIDVDAFYHGVNPDWSGTMPANDFYYRNGSLAGQFLGEQSRSTFEQAIREILQRR
jgi:thiol-disulfide isomerase/thioredoxin